MKIIVSKKNRQQAEIRSKKFTPSRLLTFSNNGQLAGYICEEIFVDNFGGLLVADKCKTHDVVLSNGKTIDIKTKRCSSEPRDHYTCSVASYQLDKATCDYYVFFRILQDLSLCWIGGFCTREEFVKNSTFTSAGTRDGPFLSRVDSYAIPISHLNSMDLLI